MSSSAAEAQWWTEPKWAAHEQCLSYVQRVEQRQAKLFDKFVKLDAMYDPNSIKAETIGIGAGDTLGFVTENVIATNVDTVTASIASVDVRARFPTDGANWFAQRQARHLEWYAEGLQKLLDVNRICQLAFKSAAIKGTGLTHAYIDGADKLRVERVPVEEIIVDESTAHSAAPRQLHRRRMVDRDELKAMYPGNDKAINNAQVGPRGTWTLWAGYRPIANNEIIVIESWRLPVGNKGKKGYQVGRHVVAIDGVTLVDEKWEEEFFPLARFAWSEPDGGWYGIGGAERIAGHQRALNRRNWQIDRLLQNNALPTTYVRMADANLQSRTSSVGALAVYKADIPHTVHQPLVNKETYQSRVDLKVSAQQEFGQSMMATSGTKPAGLDSGEALREYKDQASGRFAMQEKGFERLVLDTIWLILWCCKKLGAAAPVVTRTTRFGAKKVIWSKLDMGDVRVQIAAASTLSRTPAGRTQTVLEWAQAGIIDQDQARRLLGHPDLESEMSLYTEAIESIEHALEEILDGKVLMPEPFDNLKVLVWRGQMKYLQVRDDGAPEDILEALRQYIVQAAWIVSGGDQPANGNMAPGPMGGLPAPANDQAAMLAAGSGLPPGGPGPGPGPMPPMPAGPPIGPPPVGALAPTAMNLVAK